ncbi:MAG: MFS transporter, partial [Planctomycetota bacterium]
VDLIGFGIVLPLLPKYAEDYGAGRFELGLTLSLYSLMQFLAAPYWGRISDRIGRRPVLLVTLLASTAGYLIFALARSFEMILVSRAVAGLGGANIAVAQAMIADSTPPEERAKGMGLIGAAFGLGFIFGPALGGAATQLWGAAGPGWAATAVCGANAVAAFFVIRETRPAGPRARSSSTSPLEILHGLRRALQIRDVGRFIAVLFVAMVAFAAFEVTYSVFVRSRLGFSNEEIYWNFVYIGLLIALVQGGLVRKLVPRFGERRLVVHGAYLTAAGMVVLAVAPGLALLLLANLLIALGQGLRGPSLQALISRAASGDEQGRILGAAQGVGSIARILGPMMGSSLYAASRSEGLGVLKDALSFVAAAVLLALAGWAARDRSDRPGPPAVPPGPV